MKSIHTTLLPMTRTAARACGGFFGWNIEDLGENKLKRHRRAYARQRRGQKNNPRRRLHFTQRLEVLPCLKECQMPPNGCAKTEIEKPEAACEREHQGSLSP